MLQLQRKIETETIRSRKIRTATHDSKETQSN
jgi:hypothetical protein